MQTLINLSKYAGMREDLIQAGAGNSSVKRDDGKIYVKASGYQLTELSEEKGYACLDYKEIRMFFADCRDEDINEISEKKVIQEAKIDGERPSIEAFLHSIAEGKYVLHTHPIWVNMIVAQKNAYELLNNILGEGSYTYVEYCKPGIELAWAYEKVRRLAKSRTDIVFFANHGLLITGESYEDVIKKQYEVQAGISAYLGMDLTKYENAIELWNTLSDCGSEDIVWTVSDQNILSALEEGLIPDIQIDFAPDNVVFCNRKILCIQEKANLKARLKDYTTEAGMPKVILYSNHIYIVAKNVAKAMEIQSVLSGVVQVARYIKSDNLNRLSDIDVDRLLNWDAEKYRQNR